MKTWILRSTVVSGEGSSVGLSCLVVYCWRNLFPSKGKAARNEEWELDEHSWKCHNHLGWQGQAVCAPFLLFVLWSNQLNQGKGKESIPATNTQFVNFSIFYHLMGNAIWTDRDFSRCQDACWHCETLVFFGTMLHDKKKNEAEWTKIYCRLGTLCGSPQCLTTFFFTESLKILRFLLKSW